jgi:diadenosine tetraphosphate (Ap4A) HIT family hydrolase
LRFKDSILNLRGFYLDIVQIEFTPSSKEESLMAYDPNNIFAKILRGEIPCGRVFENEHTLAFRDIHPKAPVHILVIPKGAYEDLTAFASLAPAVEIESFHRAVADIVKAEGLDKTGYRVIANTGLHGGQEVPHYHLHILGGGFIGPMVARV